MGCTPPSFDTRGEWSVAVSEISVLVPARKVPPAPPRVRLIDRLGACRPMSIILGATTILTFVVVLIDLVRA